MRPIHLVRTRRLLYYDTILQKGRMHRVVSKSKNKYTLEYIDIAIRPTTVYGAAPRGLEGLFAPSTPSPRFHALSALPRTARRRSAECLRTHALGLSATERLQQKRNVFSVSPGSEPPTFRQNLW